MVLVFAFVLGVSMAAGVAPTPDGHPPPLPTQFSAVYGTTTAPYNVYSDGTKKLLGTYTPGTTAATFTILDCTQKLKYTNAGALPIPGQPPGPCTTSLLTSFATDCPSVYVPTWPPSAEDFYAGFRLKLTFKDKRECPIGNSSKCDHYVYDMYGDGYEVFDFYVDSATQVGVYGTIKVGKVLYTHTLMEGVNESFLERPSDCPDPSGKCAICFTGPCGPCQQCLELKTGPCAKCWVPDNTTGFSCLEDDGQSLCQKCYKPPAPSPVPPPSPPGPADTCSTHPKCVAAGLTGACCPTWIGSWLGCCDHSPACSATPKCAALGIEGDCCPTKTGHTLECCGGSGPGPAPTPPADKCDICVTGACAACKPCEQLKTGPCAPCWAKQSNGSACLPDCVDAGCWKTTASVALTPDLHLPVFPSRFRGVVEHAPGKCDICVTGACAACKPCTQLKTGPCAPCWATQRNGSACLPDCVDAGCWNTTSTMAATPDVHLLVLPSRFSSAREYTAGTCDICVTGACAACKACTQLKTGSCAPCWANMSNGSTCLPDCEPCWATTLLV